MPNHLWEIFSGERELKHKLNEGRFLFGDDPDPELKNPLVSNHFFNHGLKPVYPNGRDFAVCISHDIDFLFNSKLNRFAKLKAATREVLEGYPLRALSYFNSKSSINPNYNIDKIIDKEKSLGVKSSFYFLSLKPGDQDFNYDPKYLKNLFQLINNAGSEVGLHGGHHAFYDADRLQKERNNLEAASGLNINGYRNHFLRFDIKKTWKILNDLGFQHDSSYGFADYPAFRNGMCYPFKPYDFTEKKFLDIIEVPLIAMDATFIFYLKWTPKQTLNFLKKSVDQVRSIGGVFTLLWHNNYTSGQWGKVYESILEYCGQNNAWFATTAEVASYWKSKNYFDQYESLLKKPEIRPRKINRVLHITNWYPNVFDALESKFIKDQIDSLNSYAPSDVMHIQVKYGPLKFISNQLSNREKSWILSVPINRWLIIEWITTLMLFSYFILKFRRKKYDLINFHIAYPMLTHFNLIKKYLKVSVVVSEHWSAYRSNFGVKKELKRIKNIFKQDYTILTVSKSLANDIKNFSGMNHLHNLIVPNVLNQEFVTSKYNHINTSGPVRFFMAGYWKDPKCPLVILNALSRWKAQGNNFSLKIAGYGPQVDLMLKTISEGKLENEVTYMGKLKINEMAEQLQHTDWFLHASEYETFSVVCLESLSQGVPVIASKVGGIPEFVNETNGILISENTEDQWLKAIENRLTTNLDMKTVQKNVQENYSPTSVGLIYLKALESHIK